MDSQKENLNQGQALSIQMSYGTLRGLEWNSESEKKILMLHGWLDNCASFVPLANQLQGYHCVAMDWSGHGQSDHRPLGAHYHFIEWVPELLELLDQLDWQDFSVVAHSMGAGVVALAAGCVPERFKRIVFLDGLGPQSIEENELPMQLLSFVKHQKKEKKARKTFSDQEAMMKAREAGLPMQRSSLWWLMERGCRQNAELEYEFSFDPRLKNPSLWKFSEQQVLSFLNNIQAHTLVLLAEESFVAFFPWLPGRLEALSRNTTVSIPGNHHVHMDDAFGVSQKILSFLATSQ